MPQGCPFSCYIFILSIEPLHAHIRAKTECQGITLPGGQEVKTSGFADDTALYVANPKALEAYRDALKLYCKASGAKLNWNKCVGVAVGGKHAVSTAEWIAIPDLKWMENTQMERYLGAYLGATDLVTQQWDKMVEKIKKRAERWHKHHVSILARIIVSKSSLASCMWYMSQCMVTPAGINDKIQKIINEFVWGKQPRFMGFAEACKPKKENGMGMLCVEAQAAAFSIKQ